MDDDIDRLRSGVEVIREVCAEACVVLRKRGRARWSLGGCRCQAMAIAGDAAAADPACIKSPIHKHMAILIDAALAEAAPERNKNGTESFIFRRIGARPDNRD